MDTPNKQLHDHSLSWMGTSTSIKSGEDQTAPFLVKWCGHAFVLSQLNQYRNVNFFYYFFSEAYSLHTIIIPSWLQYITGVITGSCYYYVNPTVRT